MISKNRKTTGAKLFVRCVLVTGMVGFASGAIHPEGFGAQGMPPAGEGMQMPDAKQMSGMPLPTGDIAPGTVVVRVIRGSLGNVLAGQSVELHGAPTLLTQKTNDTGRAEFTGLPAGARVRAVTTVGGERLESQEFTVPTTGGVRVLLVATDPEAEQRSAEDRRLAAGPAEPGTVVLGDQSRFVFELGEDGISVFNILVVVNAARVPVETPEPLVFDLPERADHPSILEGSSPQASLAGKRVTVVGPFAPGATLVQFAYSIPYSGRTLTLQQKLPAQLAQFTVLAQKVGDLHLSSPQMSQHRDMAAEGQTYIVGHGPAVQAGEVVTFAFTGLPQTPAWPTQLALGLAVLILAGGAWGAARTGRAAAREQTRRRKLQSQRDRLFADLIAIEEQHRLGRLDQERYTARRRDLVSALERVYAQMDEEAAA